MVRFLRGMLSRTTAIVRTRETSYDTYAVFGRAFIASQTHSYLVGTAATWTALPQAAWRGMAATTARPEQEQPLGGAVPEEGKAWPFATTRPLDAREGLSTSGSDWSDLSDEEISDDEMREPTVNLRDLELTPKMIQMSGRADRAMCVIIDHPKFRSVFQDNVIFNMQEVRMSKDCQTVYIRWDLIHGNVEKMTKRLEQNKARIRSKLGGLLGVKYTPAVEFFHDTLTAHIEEWEQKMDKLTESLKEDNTMDEQALWAAALSRSIAAQYSIPLDTDDSISETEDLETENEEPVVSIDEYARNAHRSNEDTDADLADMMDAVLKNEEEFPVEMRDTSKDTRSAGEESSRQGDHDELGRHNNSHPEEPQSGGRKLRRRR